jgi:hypothetical protein
VTCPVTGGVRSLADARSKLADYLGNNGRHHFYVSGAEAPDPEELAVAADLTDDEAEGNADEEDEGIDE